MYDILKIILYSWLYGFDFRPLTFMKFGILFYAVWFLTAELGAIQTCL